MLMIWQADHRDQHPLFSSAHLSERDFADLLFLVFISFFFSLDSRGISLSHPWILAVLREREPASAFSNSPKASLAIPVYFYF